MGCTDGGKLELTCTTAASYCQEGSVGSDNFPAENSGKSFPQCLLKGCFMEVFLVRYNCWIAFE